MASVREGFAKDASAHSLVFRVMRLCRPALQVDMPLKYDVADIFYGEDHPNPPAAAGGDDGAGAFAARCDLMQPMDAWGLSDMMVLPQAFGSIYLGETFCSYVSVSNHSDHDVTSVTVRAELQTERQRVVLAENARAPLAALPAGGRHDFIIEHDIKELGAHTLVCSASYVDGQELKHLPQFFKFVASNPISVRTKVRTVKEDTFLEACIENLTKGHLLFDRVKFDASSAWAVESLEPEAPDDGLPENIRELFKPANFVRASGGARHFLYRLRRAAPSPGGGAGGGGGNALGKLEILWRTTLGETGRLQTQQILGNPMLRKEVELKVVDLPASVVLETPFLVGFQLLNCTDRRVGPLRVSTSRDEALGAPRAIVVSGLWALTVPPLAPQASTTFTLCLVALAAGVQKLTGVAVHDADGKPYDTLTPIEMFVETQ